jgi:hypothetical protein
MDKEILYAVAYGADRRLGHILQYRYKAWSVMAVSREEAIGKSLIRCKKVFLTADGWGGHDVSVKEVRKGAE